MNIFFPRWKIGEFPHHLLAVNICYFLSYHSKYISKFRWNPENIVNTLYEKYLDGLVQDCKTEVIPY